MQAVCVHLFFVQEVGDNFWCIRDQILVALVDCEDSQHGIPAHLRFTRAAQHRRYKAQRDTASNTACAAKCTEPACHAIQQEGAF